MEDIDKLRFVELFANVSEIVAFYQTDVLTMLEV